MYRVLGFGGPIGSGKSTIAGLATELIEQYPFAMHRVRRLSFAGELKRIAAEQFGWDGKKDERGRRLLQVLGTEAGRLYDQDIWVKKLEAVIDQDDDIVIVDDVRFVNETAWINRNGISVLVTGRAGVNIGIQEHTSETSITDCDWMFALDNSGTIDETRDILNNIVGEILCS